MNLSLEDDSGWDVRLSHMDGGKDSGFGYGSLPDLGPILQGGIGRGPAYNFSLGQIHELNMTPTVDGLPPNSGVSLAAIVCLSVIFCAVGIIGIVGNMLVIFIILCDRKMRRSVTNLFIMNLAVSDLLIMLFGVPEIVMFMINNGWLLGEALCKTQRYVLVFSLYSSVVTLVSVCVER